ncbi:MAG: MBL fold metallo-hydrolase [Bacteroidota bacterium]
MSKSSRRTFIKASALGLGSSLLPWQNFFAQSFQPQEYVMRPLRNNVGVFTDRGGTIAWLLSENGIAVVDTQFPASAKKLIGELRKTTDRKLDLLVNTHHHGDHTAGNFAFEGMVDTIVAHENSKKNQMRVAEERNQMATQLFPNTIYKDTWSGKVGEETISLKYFGAAHTDGDSVVHFENANIAHLGDLLFRDRHPYVDTSAGAIIQSWIEVLEEILKHYDKETLFVWGHAKEAEDIIGDSEALIKKRNYLTAVLEFVNKEISEGKSLEEVLKATEIPGFPEYDSRGIERPLKAAYEELSK